MRYMLLLYANEADWAASGETEEAVIADHMRLIGDLRQANRYRASDALAPIQSATTIRVRGGKTVVTDGPYAETKEQLGGYYIVDANDLDEVIAVAARIPDAKVGSVEIRPIRQIKV